jgi:nicotinic acid mononucleotide adenylyltransferase
MEYNFPTLDKDLENWYRKNNLLKTSHFIICGKPKDENIILPSKFGG